MKLLVQSDDYGITRAAAQGCLYGIRCGIVRNTGMFTNMPWAEEVAEWIRPYLDQISLGIDLNASTGSSLLGYDKVPSLCHEDGTFLSSKENYALDNEANGFDHVNFDEIYTEFEAQTEKFIALFGKAPDYIHGHAYGTKTVTRAHRAIAEKYVRPYSVDIIEDSTVANLGMNHYRFGNDLNAQLQDDLKDRILNAPESFVNADRGFIISHCGYLDAELFGLTSFTIYRMKDLEALTSSEVLEWVRKNNIELVRYSDLAK
ncbi:MAG: ChbG/HpnK family deacetylase [Solobacterium sp.]|nr:ChbG/HpnK family deacetylase [Solobacterium sp.]